MNSLPRAYVPSEGWANSESVLLPTSEWHHLVKVLRLGEGDRLILFDGTGREAEGIIEGRASRRVRVIRLWRREAGSVSLVLYQAVLKQEAMDCVIRKAVELGVSDFWPVEADRSIPRILGERAAARGERWRTIALDAARQCQIVRLPAIHPVVRLETVLEDLPGLDCVFVGSLMAGSRPLLSDALPLLEVVARRGRAGVGLFIGPEGDWTEAEHERLVRAGARPVTFGENILRADTAACYGLSVLRALFTAGAEIRRFDLRV